MMATLLQTPALSLADLDAQDPRPRVAGVEQRYLCPLCGHDKPRDEAHRCLCLNTQSGLWNCKRCQAAGKLRDAWQERPTFNRRERTRLALQSRFALPQGVLPPSISYSAVQEAFSSDLEAGSQAKISSWRALWEGARVLDGNRPEENSLRCPGVVYLERRGVPLEAAQRAGVRFCPDWAPRRDDAKPYRGGAAVLFPLCDESGTLLGVNGRYIWPEAKPKVRTGGAAGDGAFAAPILLGGKLWHVWDAPAVILCEGPIDALSLAAAGYPALALSGCTLPTWMHRRCAFKRVLLASDADRAGDEAAAQWEVGLSPYGARCERLRPEGGKDWNEVLCSDGQASLGDWLALRVLHDENGRALW